MKLRFKFVEHGGEQGLYAYLDGGMVSSLSWDALSGTIRGVHTEPDLRRQGIATELYRKAQDHTGGKLKHSAWRTASGDRWARAVGGALPPLDWEA